VSLRRSACAGPARPNRNGTIKHCWKCPGRGFRRHWRLNVGRSISDAKLPLSPVLPPRRPARVHCQATSIMILAPRCISTRSRNLRLPLRRQKPLQTILAREPTLGRRKKLPAGKSEPTPHPSVHHRPQSSSSSRFTARYAQPRPPRRRGRRRWSYARLRHRLPCVSLRAHVFERGLEVRDFIKRAGLEAAILNSALSVARCQATGLFP